MAAATLIVPVTGTAELSYEGIVTAGETVLIRTGIFLYDSGTATEAITVTAIGKPCYALDDQTIGIKGGTNAIAAGIVADVMTDGVAVKIG